MPRFELVKPQPCKAALRNGLPVLWKQSADAEVEPRKLISWGVVVTAELNSDKRWLKLELEAGAEKQVLQATLDGVKLYREAAPPGRMRGPGAAEVLRSRRRWLST